MRKWKGSDSEAVTNLCWDEAVEELNRIDAEIADITKHPLYKKRMKAIEQLARIAKKYPKYKKIVEPEESQYIKTNVFAGKEIEDIVE